MFFHWSYIIDHIHCLQYCTKWRLFFFFNLEKKGWTGPCGAGEIEAAGHLYHGLNLTDNYRSQTSPLPVAPFQSHFKSAAGDMTLCPADRERERESGPREERCRTTDWIHSCRGSTVKIRDIINAPDLRSALIVCNSRCCFCPLARFNLFSFFFFNASDCISN